MNDNQTKGLSIYIDMRGSTKLNRETKIGNVNKLYNKFNSYNVEYDSIYLKYTSLIGDGVLMFFKYGKLNNEIINLLTDIDNKVKDISSLNIKYGIGVAYGLIDFETYEVNDNSISIPLGQSVDFSAKASDLGNKNSEFPFAIFLKNKAKTIESKDNHELYEYLSKAEEIETKKTSSGNAARLRIIV